MQWIINQRQLNNDVFHLLIWDAYLTWKIYKIVVGVKFLKILVGPGVSTPGAFHPNEASAGAEEILSVDLKLFIYHPARWIKNLVKHGCTCNR